MPCASFKMTVCIMLRQRGDGKQKGECDTNAGKNQGNQGGSNIAQAVRSVSKLREPAELWQTPAMRELQ